MTTRERLALDLEAAGLESMAALARQGYYDDYESTLDTPQVQLRTDLIEHGRPDLAKLVLQGKWDATKEEGEDWYRNEGRDLIDADTRRILFGDTQP